MGSDCVVSQAPEKGRWIRISYRWNNALWFPESLCNQINDTMTRPFCPYTSTTARSPDSGHLTLHLFTNDVFFSSLFPRDWSLMKSNYGMQARKREHLPLIFGSSRGAAEVPCLSKSRPSMPLPELCLS